MGLIMSDNIRKMLNENMVLEKAGMIDKEINLSEISDSDELVNRLLVTNSMLANENRDKMAIKWYLELRKKGINSMHHYFEGPNINMNITKAAKYSDESGMMISGHEKAYTDLELKSRGKFDYRITLRGSNEIITEEALAFTDTLVSEANKRNLNIRMKDPWTHDAVILYIDKEELLGTVKMLEDLKDSDKYGEMVSNATKHFGPVMPFAATISEDSYYGISMAHSELAYGRSPSLLLGAYGGGFGNTFGDYIEDECLSKTYNELLKKYANDMEKITVDEMYKGLIKEHKKYMLGDENSREEIPLWMNRRNYIEAKEKKLVEGPRLTGTLLKQIQNKEIESGFRRPTDSDLDDNVNNRHR